MEPMAMFMHNHDMIVAKGQVPVRLLNLSDQYAKLHKGKK